ncbi:MAG: ATP-binding cassette domain-containing protein [Candidatus Electrothrix sp. GW3-4]|uniref:ABC transporter ATP-binding protein n=1 Tax=Candidatus Electrothrix sp. GW3-4 TaxID=3126740 RepID=UPI0030CEAA79
MLEVTQLSFAYNGGSPLFRNLNITLHPGEVTGLIAPSGSGKTTLAKVLSGHLPVQEGEIRLNHLPVPGKSFYPVQLINQHPEQGFNPRWTLGRSLVESFKPASSLLAQLGIKKSWLNRYPHELSGGELQRFAIARALHPKTAFLIADEITAMLDAISQAQVWQVLLHINKERGLGMLVISHNPQLLARICTRKVSMSEL